MKLNKNELEIYINLLRHAADNNVQLIYAPEYYKALVDEFDRKSEIAARKQEIVLHYRDQIRQYSHWDYYEHRSVPGERYALTPCGISVDEKYWDPKAPRKNEWDKHKGGCTDVKEAVTCIRCRKYLKLPILEQPKKEGKPSGRLITLEL